MKTVPNRICSDYLMPTRLAEYHGLPGRACRICLLTHPAQWETNWGESTRCDLRRLAEELAWRA
jgi:uracil-DNA glycosylase